MKERSYRRWAAQRYEEHEVSEANRGRELAGHAERRKRRRQVPADGPELARTWLLLGVGRSSSGAEVVVRRYPDAVLPEEVVEQVVAEVKARRPWNRLRCHQPLEPVSTELPELSFLQVMDGDRVMVDGWAFDGQFCQRYAACPKCVAEQPVMTGAMASFGRADEVLAALLAGTGFAEGAGPETSAPAVPQMERVWWARLLGLQTRSSVKASLGILVIVTVVVAAAALAWAVFFFMSHFSGAVQSIPEWSVADAAHEAVAERPVAERGAEGGGRPVEVVDVELDFPSSFFPGPVPQRGHQRGGDALATAFGPDHDAANEC